MSNERKSNNLVLGILLQSLQGGTEALGTLQNTVGNTLQNTVEKVNVVENTVGNTLQNTVENIDTVENTVNNELQNTVAAINTISLISITSALETILTKLAKKE